LVIVQAEYGVKDLDLPLGGAFDFLAKVERRLGRLMQTSNVFRAASASGGGGFKPGFLGSNR